MTDKEKRELAFKRMQMSWLLYGTLYITRGENGDIVVHDGRYEMRARECACRASEMRSALAEPCASRPPYPFG